LSDSELLRKDATALCAYTAKRLLLAASLVNRMQASAACSQDNAYWQLALALGEELTLIGHALGKSNEAMQQLSGVCVVPREGGMIQ
jgi:hypothetical protein